MVANTLAIAEGESRWLKYLALSGLINALVISTVTIDKPLALPLEVASLSISLMAKAESVQTKAPVAASEQVKPAITKKIKTKKQAVKKIAIAKNQQSRRLRRSRKLPRRSK